MRSTAIRRFSDVDILAIFDHRNEDGQGNSKDLLDLAAQMVSSFTHTMTRTPTTISLHYSDWPDVDVLPAWTATSDGKQEAFRIPAGIDQAWQLYRPSQPDRIVQDGSARLGPRFKIIIRAIKWWNRLRGEFLQSYEIEELVNNLFAVEIPEYAEAIHSTFDAIMHKLSDVGPNDRRGGSIPSNVETAWLLSRKARDMAIEGHDKRSLEVLFRRLFGEQFPVVCS